jgi:hypothetical protein
MSKVKSQQGKEAFMPEEVVGDSATGGAAAGGGFESPPAAPVAERREFDPRARLHEIAMALVKTRDRRLLVEYLRLRRAVR